jgi:hypothetical protein
MSAEYKEELLKVAADLRSIAESLKQMESAPRHEKRANDPNFSLGEVRPGQSGSDPLMDFIFS